MHYKKSFKTYHVKLYEASCKTSKLKLVKQTGANTDASTSDKKNDDNVVDAEFEEVKEDK